MKALLATHAPIPYHRAAGPLDLREQIATLGYMPCPRYQKGYAASWEAANGVDIPTGKRADGLTLVRLDLDQHRPEQNAGRALRSIRAQLDPRVAASLVIQQSLGGSGRDVLFLTETPVASGVLYHDGLNIGEALANGGGGRAHADTPFLQGSLDTIPVLSTEDTAAVLNAAGYSSRATDRAALRRLGESLTAGFERYTRPGVIDALLVEHNGAKLPRIFEGDKRGQQIGRNLWLALMKGEPGLDRSAAYANLLQSLAFHAYGLGRTATERWQKVRALAEYVGSPGTELEFAL